MPAVWSCFDVATGEFLWYTQNADFANTDLEPTPGAWILVEDPTDHITGLVFVGAPTMYAGNYYQFRDPTTFAITVSPVASAAATTDNTRPSLTASFVEQVLVLRGADPEKAKSKAAKMVARLTEDDWDHLDE